jgi:hypothetical protein
MRACYAAGAPGERKQVESIFEKDLGMMFARGRGRRLTDPVIITRGIGPECIQAFPTFKAALKAKILEIAKLRYGANTLVERLTRAGFDDMVEMISLVEHEG